MIVHKLLPATKMDKRVLLFFFLINIIYVWSSPHMVHLMNKREIFCGTKLAETLAMLCKGNYYSPNPNPTKKSTNDIFAYNEYDEYFPNESDDENQIDFPFLQKESVNSFLPIRFRRTRVGIVDECCRKPCTLKHLSLYCGQ
ncbi:LIRP-like [Tribolium madens]|uniref:LIRP-like n=1 Tax=Tribolium madens TaxID=41895 RepID=UPI001CF76701|nr:LIRP-like [Tribolium madens]